ncbi:hypothetical protein MJO28_016851 [Puccinia striiformis f. sp. tritici]|uniref:Uncharacterized protein n=2 Tax=Puccinia striiformis TaxID=27350 RepID=A0A0L0W332_9BASI|nr:hypothetical protein MJO28_016851 [Puccinia striiformis f. sp. tritici]KAI9618335.1 hypothetical protein KEM48_006788 [Puccinia striiformis f. sp. tritici PST-130]KNF05872.1 hypothetical protein PSTG_00866 [Puccinia striiformis f. sp. tritici PST-78]POW13633.1 hypothetical protein PSTT_03525 [Puccinia striiformis]
MPPLIPHPHPITTVHHFAPGLIKFAWKMITLKSCMFVSEEPPRLGTHLFKILDANPWSTTLPHPKPLSAPLMDIYTSAPRSDLPDAASWFVFEGSLHAPKNNNNLVIHTHSSSYHHTIPCNYDSLPFPRLSGLLRIVSDTGVKTAIDPDNQTSCLFSLTAAPQLDHESLHNLDKDNSVYLTADVVHYLYNIVHLKVRFFEII